MDRIKLPEKIAILCFKGIFAERIGGTKTQKEVTVWIKEVGAMVFNRFTGTWTYTRMIIETKNWEDMSETFKEAWFKTSGEMLECWDQPGNGFWKVLEFSRKFLSGCKIYSNSPTIAERFLNNVGVNGLPLVQSGWTSEKGGYWDRAWSVDSTEKLFCPEPLRGICFEEKLKFFASRALREVARRELNHCFPEDCFHFDERINLYVDEFKRLLFERDFIQYVNGL